MKKIVILLLLFSFIFSGCLYYKPQPQNTNTYNPPANTPNNNSDQGVEVLVQSIHDYSHVINKDTNSYIFIPYNESDLIEQITEPNIDLNSILTKNAIILAQQVFIEQEYNVLVSDQLSIETITDNLFIVLVIVNNLYTENGRIAISIGISVFSYDDYISGTKVDSKWYGFFMIRNSDYIKNEKYYLYKLISFYGSENIDEWQYW